MYHPVRSTRRRRSPAVMVFMAFAGTAVAAVGGVAALWAAGLVDLPFLRRPVSRAGLTPVVMSNQAIPAYTKITRDHVADPRTGDFSITWVPSEGLSADLLRDPSQIVGRVLNHDKLPGYCFVEEDFLPKGSRPGLVGGTPEGKRSLTLIADQLTGIHGLRAGDHIDLVATTPIDVPRRGDSVDAQSKGLAAQAERANLQKRASVRVLAQDAVIVTPVTTRQKPVSSPSLTQGVQLKTVPVQEIVIAVEPKEVAPVSEAMAMKLDVMCVIRSGRPDDPGPTVETPGADPLAEVPINVVESIVGKKRETRVFTSASARKSAEGTEVAADEKRDGRE